MAQAVKRTHIRRLIILDESISDPYSLYWLYTRMYCRLLRYGVSLDYQRAKRQFMRKHWQDNCYRCGERGIRHTKNAKLAHNARTVDHVIPVWLLRATDMIQLIVDEANFKICCSQCNRERGVELDTVGAIRAELGDRVVDKLFEKSGIFLPDETHHSINESSKLLW